MMEEFSKVRIKATGVPGTIVDISVRDGKRLYIVESDVPHVDGSDELWKLFDCREDEIEPWTGSPLMRYCSSASVPIS